MRSACWGARSGRSWITTLPFVVSKTIVFCGSAVWAAAGKFSANRQRKASAARRNMKAPGLFFGEFGGEFGEDGLRHERRYVAVHGGDLPDQCGGDRAHQGRRRQEHGLNRGLHRTVHARHLHFSIESRSFASNSGFLPGCTPTASTSLSASRQAPRTTSRCPLVTGSKEPA